MPADPVTARSARKRLVYPTLTSAMASALLRAAESYDATAADEEMDVRERESLRCAIDRLRSAGKRAHGYPPEKQPLPIGTVFDTPAESGCVVTSLPDADGNFLALDSDGVECSFSRVMVARVHQ
jgi:hypothetical protein